ncbi:MAG TPA: hypothetical protein DHV42_01405 [Lachnospiraceae bacterium]|nr:hypothetical protein [Lachnospiraceae bacterium]
MRRRLEQLLNETFEYDPPRLTIEPAALEEETEAGGTVQGSLTLIHPEGKRCRGFVYSSNARVVAETAEFYSPKSQIRYHADLAGLAPGQKVEGRFTVCSELGEESIPYCFRIRKEEVPSPMPDPDALAELARTDLGAAAQLYASEPFGKSLEGHSFETLTLWKALPAGENAKHALEQFLIASQKKEMIELSLSRENQRIVNPEGTVLEEITLSKSTWGYMEIEITSDTRFLRVEKKHVTTEEFIGATWPLRYVVDSNFLHAGRNLGRITVHTCYQTLAFELCVEVKGQEDLRAHRVRNVMTRKAVRLYLDYRLGRIDLHQWTERTQSVIESYKRSGGKNLLADLLGVFVLQADGKRASAERELHRIERNARILEDGNAQAAWLYLSTFFSKDEEYRMQVRERMRELSLKHRSSWLIRWLSLYLLEDEFGQDAGKLDMILGYVEQFHATPFLLLEGVQIVRNNPFLLHEWTPGARIVINWAVKEKVLDERMILHSMNLIRRRGGFDPVTFRMLGTLYEDTHMDDVLAVRAQMAIDGEKKEEKYFPLYQAAVARDLKITGLYEYYMQTMSEVRIEQMPQVIRRYFAMNETMDWQKKARIYRNLSDSEESIPQIFSAMRPGMEKFITDQIQMGRINDDLSALISRYLTHRMVNAQLARKLIRLLFTFEVDCLSPDMKRVVVCDVRRNREYVTPIENHAAKVRIYSEQSRIVLEDAKGRRYASTDLYMARHLLNETSIMNLCTQVVPDDPHLVMFFTLNPQMEQPITHKTLKYYIEGARMAAFSDSYRARIQAWLLDYYAQNPQEETLPGFLREIDMDTYVRIDRIKLLSLLTQDGRYEKAWTILEQYGTQDVDLNRLMRILSQVVIAREYEEDRKLLGFCAQLFSAGKVEEHILIYLLMYYEGPVESMKNLWRVGREYGLDTINLEKKILSLILFTRQGSENSEQVYRSYRRSLGSRRICQAYVIWRCYEFLVKDRPVSEAVFDDCLIDYQKGGKLPDVCALALLQYLSRLPEHTQEQREAAVTLLKKYSEQGIRFAFFTRFPYEMRQGLGCDDRVFCEAVASPKSTVRLFYRTRYENEPFMEITMKDVFEGIRVREFVLFEGEQLECYTEETRENGETTVSAHRFLRPAPVPEEILLSRYGRLTAMARDLEHGDEKVFQEKLKEYRQLDSLTKEIFTLME